MFTNPMEAPLDSASDVFVRQGEFLVSKCDCGAELRSLCPIGTAHRMVVNCQWCADRVRAAKLEEASSYWVICDDPGCDRCARKRGA